MKDIQKIRDEYIRILDNSDNSTMKAKEMVEDLFALDLTVYSKNNSFDSILYNALSISKLDENVSLHPEQLKILEEIEKNEALIVSAPTSFGKTFCIFEYIIRYKPNNIVLIVPTLALVDEYRKKIIKRYRDKFQEYKIYSNIDEEKQYDFTKKNIFILTHDRVVQEMSYTLIEKIDFLVIDEVYKLEKDLNNDRVLVLNMAYYYMAKIAKKYVLLAPFIKSVEDTELLEKKPTLYTSEYSPVVNEVINCEIINDKDREDECKRILDNIGKKEKTLIYFPTVTGIYNYIKNVISKEKIIEDLDESIKFFIDWAKEEIHEEWGIIKALERGYLIHNGQLPIGTRLFQMNLYEKSQSYNRLLCTSTLLEGVNTSAKNIIITRPSRTQNNTSDNFSAFDFYNLVGRTGRLYEHFLGRAYYIKGPMDSKYEKIDAIRNIKFELTDESKDIDLQTGNIDEHKDIIEFLKMLKIDKEEYCSNIGNKVRFDTVKKMYNKYKEMKSKLLQELQNLISDNEKGRYGLVSILYTIINDKNNTLESNIITRLLNRNRPRLKSVINAVLKGKEDSIDFIITTTIRMKMGYIEHEFYTKVLIIRYFLEKDGIEEELINKLNEKVINAIEQLYFSDSIQKKMLIDMGIYERDVERVINVIGGDFEDEIELKNRLQLNLDKIEKVSFITKYVINNLI